MGKGVGNDEDNERIRPLKVTFKDQETVFQLLAKSKNLKEILDGKVYIKSDRSKSEREEFSRLAKRKEQAQKEYPTAEGSLPRVNLKKGILTVDGRQIDKYVTPQSLF